MTDQTQPPDDDMAEPWPRSATDHESDQTGVLPSAPNPVAPDPDPPAEMSRWPWGASHVVRYLPIGWEPTRVRIVRYVTEHPGAWQLDELADEQPEGWEEEYDHLEYHQRWDLAAHKRRVVYAIASLPILVWILVSAAGMRGLIIGTAAVLGWYTAKGRYLVWRRPSPMPGELETYGPDEGDDPTIELRRPTTAPARDPAPAPVEPRGFMRLVRSPAPARTERRTEPAPARAPDPLPVPAPDPGPARPEWLTRTIVEQRLLNAHKPLRTSIPLRTPAEGLPVRIDLLGSEFMDNGWQLTLELPEDVTASKIMNLREDVARVFRVPMEQILMHVGSDHPGILVLWVCDYDPLRSVQRWSNLLELDETNMHEGYVLGEDLFGRPITYKPIGNHCLTTGTTGSGKSVIMKLKVAHLLMDPHHQVIIIDPNGGEWRSYRDVVIYFGGPGAMADALDHVRKLVNVELPRRANRLAELKELYPLRIPELKIPEWLARDKTEALFAFTLVIEEAPELFMGDDGDDWNDLLTRFSAQYRKYLGHLELTFQRASNRAMGGKGVELRDLVTTAFAGSVRSEASAKMALGDDWKKRGMNPLAILPGVHAGTFVATGGALDLPAGTGDHILLKARFTDDAEGLQVRKRALELRQRVRPLLLPVHSRPDPTRTGSGGSAPGPDPAPDRTPVARLRPDDPQHLMNIIDCFRGPEDRLWSTTIVERLQANHAGGYDDLTVYGMKAFLDPFEIETTDVRERGGGGRLKKGLSLYVVEDAYNGCRDSCRDGCRDDCAIHGPRHASHGPESAPDLRRSDSSANDGLEAASDETAGRGSDASEWGDDDGESRQ